MKTNCFLKSLSFAASLAAFSAAGGAENVQPSDAPSSPAKDVAATTVTTTVPGPTTSVPIPAADNPDVDFSRWTDIKGCTYDMRPQFFEGLDRLVARVDREIASLTARRAAMKSTANTQEWDFAMKEMENSQSSLKSLDEELHKASPEIWNQEKDKVGQAMVRTQNAYKKVKSSITF